MSGELYKLTLLKNDIGIHTDSKDDFLNFLLNSANEKIKREGIVEEDTAEYTSIQVEYAAYLWRKRASAETAMPRFLRYEMNNLLISQKGKKAKGNGNDV